MLFFKSFSTFSQVDSAKYRFAKTVFQLAKEQVGNSSTIPLTLSRFLVFQSLATNTAIPQSSELTNALTRTRNQVTASGEVPIGIINAIINNPITGEKQRIFIASPLQKDVFQAAVQFRRSPLLLQNNSSVPIDSIALDFNDGQGWHTFPFTEQLVSHQFTTLGERIIGIKLITKEEVVTIQIPFDVKQLERPAIYDSQRVIANASTTAKAGRATENVIGAEYRIHLGCDGVFDKPVIIAEGFDANEDVNLDDLTAKYYPYLYDLRNNGYDLVLVLVK